MLVPKKATASPSSTLKIVPIRTYGKQLRTLYARRSAVNALIQSLEDYQRFRAGKTEQREPKTA
jgi:hypothetical protein